MEAELDKMMDMFMNTSPSEEFKGLIGEVFKEDIYRKAISNFGGEKQIWMCIEEMGELMSAINKFKRGRCSMDDVIT